MTVAIIAVMEAVLIVKIDVVELELLCTIGNLLYYCSMLDFVAHLYDLCVFIRAAILNLRNYLSMLHICSVR